MAEENIKAAVGALGRKRRMVDRSGKGWWMTACRENGLGPRAPDLISRRRPKRRDCEIPCSDGLPRRTLSMFDGMCCVI
jgi:hypothetical protein